MANATISQIKVGDTTYDIRDANADTRYVKLTGDTMSGNLTIQKNGAGNCGVENTSNQAKVLLYNSTNAVGIRTEALEGSSVTGKYLMYRNPTNNNIYLGNGTSNINLSNQTSHQFLASPASDSGAIAPRALEEDDYITFKSFESNESGTVVTGEALDCLIDRTASLDPPGASITRETGVKWGRLCQVFIRWTNFSTTFSNKGMAQGLGGGPCPLAVINSSSNYLPRNTVGSTFIQGPAFTYGTMNVADNYLYLLGGMPNNTIASGNVFAWNFIYIAKTFN